MIPIQFILILALGFRETESVLHTLVWTEEGLSQNSPDSPLMVKIGDAIGITECDNLLIYVLFHREQYDACACEVPPYTCSQDARQVIVPCIPGLGGSFRISNPDGTLGAVDSYSDGSTYYLAGFPEGEESCGLMRLKAVFSLAMTSTTAINSSISTDAVVVTPQKKSNTVILRLSLFTLSILLIPILQFIFFTAL